MYSGYKSENQRDSAGKLELQDLKQFNRLYDKFKTEFNFKLFESQKGSDHSDRSVERKDNPKDDNSDHGTPDDEDEYLAIKRRKLKGKLMRKSSHSPKPTSTGKTINRSSPLANKDGTQKTYVSPYSVANTRPTASTPGSLRNPKHNSSITSSYSSQIGSVSAEKKKISKRLKGMSLLRVRDKFHVEDDDFADDDNDNEDDPVPEVSDFRDFTHSNTKSSVRDGRSKFGSNKKPY